jgi:hypothetical protein
MEKLFAFHNRLVSSEAPPFALAIAPSPLADDVRHPWSMTPQRTGFVPPPVTIKPRRPTIDPDLVLANQLE